ncbi:MAG: type II toxin-antitoxin system HicB family antitoxin [Spirochaetota bacterium]
MSDRYTYRVEWSAEDDAYIGRCLEFSSLGGHGESAQEALSEIESVVAESVQWMLEDGETPPEPLGSATFKGNILFRTTPETHRELSTRAQEAGVSLNQYLQSLIQRQLAAASVEQEVHELSQAVYRIERRLETSDARPQRERD